MGIYIDKRQLSDETKDFIGTLRKRNFEDIYDAVSILNEFYPNETTLTFS